MRKHSTFNYSIREQLELFLSRRNEILDSRLLKSGYYPSFSYGWNYLQGMKIGCSEPNEDDLRSVLTVYRKFVSNDSPIYMNKIFNICQLHLLSEELKNELVEIRNRWTNELRFGFLSLNIDNNDLSPALLSDLWLNAAYFHDDWGKIKFLESLMPNAMSYILVRQNFLNHIWESLKYILYVGYIVKIGLREGLFDSDI